MIGRFANGMWFLLRGAVFSVFGNLSLAVISVALAVSLWLFVTDRENPTEAQTFNSSIPIRFVNVPNDLAVANSSANTVRVRIEAPSNELTGLQQDDFAATVDLGGLDAGRHTVTVQASSSNGRVDVIDVIPSRVDVTLEDRRSKEVPVRVALTGAPQQGFVAGETTSEPNTVTVTGAESLIALVDHVAADANLAGVRVDYVDERVTLRPQDVRGGEISRVDVSPATARITVDIEQREYTLGFAVNPSITGLPEAGFQVAGITTEPALVSVTATLDVLQSIDSVTGIRTEDVSIENARSDVTVDVALRLPEGARAQGASTVRVTVAIQPTRGEASFQVVPQVRNVGDGLVVLTPTQTVTVTLSGDLNTINSISPESILVVADAQGLGAGDHLIPLQISPPPGTTVVRSEPGELPVTLQVRP